MIIQVRRVRAIKSIFQSNRSQLREQKGHFYLGKLNYVHSQASRF